jgi:predicted dehydrogenase
MSCAAFAGSGHRLEFYGDDGTLILANPTADYMRGFALSHTCRPDSAFVTVAAEVDPLDGLFPGDGRIAPVSRLASRFLDAIEHKKAASPGFAEGYRVQVLLDAVRRSHDQRRFLDTKPGTPP